MKKSHLRVTYIGWKKIGCNEILVKNWGSKQSEIRKNVSENMAKNILSKNIFDQKNSVKKILGPKNFGSQKWGDQKYE